MAMQSERLDEFFRRLMLEPPARSYDEAFGQVSRVLNEVEDELSGIEYNLRNAGFDGRMYPPTWDNIRRHPNRPSVYLLLSRGHLTMIGHNGAIKTSKRTADQTIIDKPGEDGRKVDQL